MRRIDMGVRPVGYLAWSPAGRYLAVVARDKKRRLGRPKLVVISPEGEGPPRWVEVSEGVRGWLTGYDWVTEEEGIVAAFDRSTHGTLVRLRLSKKWEMLGLSGAYHSGPHVDRSTKRLFFLRQGLERPQVQCVTEWPWKRARVVVDLNRRVRRHIQATGRTVTWTARDGVTLSGIVLETPRRRRGVLVWLHGGPAEHIGATFSPYFHVFCGAGLDVFAPNYRGSTGRDEAFLRASRGRLGRDDAGDVEQGIATMFGRDVLVCRRIVLAGWSYGGTLALRLVARGFPAACVVTGAPIADFTSLGGAWRVPHVMAEYLGTPPWLDRTAADAVSPLTWLDAVQRPVLILQGQHDGVVPVSQGRLLYRALKARGIPADLVVYPGEGHVMSSPIAVEDMLQRIVRWSLDHLGESR